ncbi:MAG: glycosyltransferase family 2 protein [Bacillota bacterium]|nr:glycosyltransferase family 2 protein [Bacillota bacterium]
MKVVALIPAYNEEETIASTLVALQKIALLNQIVVINDGSTDETAEVVKRHKGVTLLNSNKNSGKGAALNYGLQNFQADIFVLLDADLGHTAIHGERLIYPVLKGNAHMTIAKFQKKQSSSQEKMGFGLVRRLATLGVKVLTKKTITSPLSGQRAINAEVLQRLGPFFAGFSVEIGLTVGALHHGYDVLEIPLPMKHRAYGRGIKGIKHRGNQLIHVFRGLHHCWQKGWR